MRNVVKKIIIDYIFSCKLYLVIIYYHWLSNNQENNWLRGYRRVQYSTQYPALGKSNTIQEKS